MARIVKLKFLNIKNGLQLKPKARFIVTGYVLKGKTFKELAQETKLTERAAASTYYRSIEKLRIKIEKEK